jgi:hypothetical protein
MSLVSFFISLGFDFTLTVSQPSRPPPPFFFEIDEITESGLAAPNVDIHGNWMPSTDQNANVTFTAGATVSGKSWFCDKLRIYETPRPQAAQLYKTFSVYYSGGVGFWILKGDARQPPDDDGWHGLQFNYYNGDYSSYLTNAGQYPTLNLQPQDQDWADLLLPNTYHTHRAATSTHYGGLTGELPIFLALMAFSTSRDYLPGVLPFTLNNGVWVSTHNWKFQSELHSDVITLQS